MAVDAVPVKSPVTFPMSEPEKVVAVIIPDAFIFPDVLNPTPIPSFGLPPTWNGFAGFVVPTPTEPSTYIGVTPEPGLTSVH